MARKHRGTRRHRRGGAGAADPSTYSSGASYGMAVNGSGDSQFNRVFSQTGPDARFPSNQSVGAQGQNLGYSPSNSTQRGGSRKKKGGFWGHILNQALVPFSILGMQQTYRRKKHGGKKTRRHHR